MPGDDESPGVYRRVVSGHPVPIPPDRKPHSKEGQTPPTAEQYPMKWKNIASITTTFFITATVTEWQPIFMHARARTILLDDLQFYRQKYQARILAYVIMPEHYHLVIELNQPEDLHGWLRDMQSHSAKGLAKWLRETRSGNELAIFERHANGKSEIAVWKEQARALGLITERVLRTKIEYIHNNPVKRHLVENPGHWQWSSWRNYYHDDDSILRIDKVDML